MFAQGESILDTQVRESVIKPGIPRAVEAAIALFGLILTAPLLLLSAAAITLTSRGGVLFRQKRVGRNQQIFTLYKFRTMRPSDEKLQITARDDERVTWIGKILRRTKIDELPELWNVLRGEMSLVGPRPEVERFVDSADERWQIILSARPGITDPVTLLLRNEEMMLVNVEGNREEFYRTQLQPFKLNGYVKYLQTRNWWGDFKVLGSTAVAVIFPGKQPPPTVDEISARAK